MKAKGKPVEESPPSAPGGAGFTLVEMLVAVLLTSLLVAGALSAFQFQRWVLRSNEIKSETRHNLRTAMDMMTRDLRMAGYGLEVDGSDLTAWIDWVQDIDGAPVTMDSNPKIIDGSAGGPDGIWIAAAFEEPAAALSSAAGSGTLTLQLGSGEGAEFDDSQRRVIFLGKAETVRVTDVTGDTLTISTHPTQDVGLKYDHPAGSTLELVSVRSYEQHAAATGYPHVPYLTRDESIPSRYSTSNKWERLIASGIEDVQITQTDNRVEIALTGRATASEWYYQDPTEQDGYRRKTVTSTAFMRNMK